MSKPEELDPISTGRGDHPFLTGIKLSNAPTQGEPTCPGAQSGDIIFRQEYNFAQGSKFKGALGIWANRGQKINVCNYYGSDPKRAVNRFWFGKDPMTQGLTPHSEGAKIDLKKYVGYLPGNPSKPFVDTYHQVLAFQDKCPTWTDTAHEQYDLNEGTKGPVVRLCGLKQSDVKDCCMGKKTTCRPDIKPQSVYCDSFMTNYCLLNPKDAVCVCMKPPDSPMSKNITAPSHCWYKPCADNIGKAYLLRDKIAIQCPPINNVDCSINNAVLNAKDVTASYISAFNQQCSITTNTTTKDGKTTTETKKVEATKDNKPSSPQPDTPAPMPTAPPASVSVIDMLFGHSAPLMFKLGIPAVVLLVVLLVVVS